MSQFYDQASLVVVPSGYKAGTVYAQKPLTTDGQLVFTRTGDTATRVNSAGIIDRVRTNLVLQSETFNTTWSASRGAVTANATTAPNGTTTADKFVPDTQVNPHFISQSIASLTNGGIYTSSVYAKAGEWNSIAIFRFDSAIGVSFRLDTQAMTVLAGSPVTYSITDAGNGWYRCSMSFAIASTSDGAQFRIGNNGGYSIAGNNVNGLFLWGAQYETTDFGATPYIPTTTAAVSVGPVANVPRLDYLGSTCPRLILEPQRTNLVTYSEQIDNAAWSKTRSTITANNAVSPDGYTNADRITDTTFTANSSFVERTISSTIGTAYTYSCFVKAGTAPHVYIGIFDGSNYTAIFNPSTGVNTFTTSGATSAITSYGNGWYRISITRTVGTVTIYPYIGVCQLSNSITYNGTGAYTAQLWGAQLEAGAYATSYIPTLAASVTRGADITTKTGISSLIGQTNGTAQMKFVMDFDTSGDSTTMLGIHAGTSTSNRIQLTSRFGTVRLLVIANNSIVTNDLLYDAAPNEVVNVAFKYGSAGVTAYVNGTQRYTTASAVVFTETMTLFTIGNRSGIDDYGKGQRVSQSLLFNSALTNAQLAELTTL